MLFGFCVGGNYNVRDFSWGRKIFYLNSCFLQVFPFGSVPLKTYLPDGDIDLTAFAGINAEEALSNGVVAVLCREEQNGNSEFIVKDVQLICAEVIVLSCF